MASVWLDDELARGEQRGELGDHLRRPLQVEASGEGQHRRAEGGECGAGGRGVERSLSGKGRSRLLVSLFRVRSLVSLGGGVPAAIHEGGHGYPVVLDA